MNMSVNKPGRGKIELLVVLLGLMIQSQFANAQDEAVEEPFTVEYYYKVKWGYFAEFYELYKKNHYPILKRQQDLGRIVKMEAAFPINHAGEADRWDMRYTIVYRNVSIAHEDFDTSAIISELYPDLETFRSEEQRRFEILLEHTDIPIWTNDLSDWSVDP